MSELKAFDVGLGRFSEDGSPCVVAFDADQNPRLLNEKVYLKDEVDKVLAKKDKELCRHKYKQCLAMADKCVDLCHKSKDLYRWADDENLEHYYNHKIEFFARWHKRWLELAEKFKEAK